MRKSLTNASVILFYVSGGLLWLVTLWFFYVRWDLTGLVLAVVVVPLAIAAPFIALVVTGISPVTICMFSLWGFALFCFIIGGVVDKDKPAGKNT